MKLDFIKRIVVAGLMVFSANGNTVVDYELGVINRTVSDATYFGGCMIGSPDFNPSNSCLAGWASIDCEGNFTSKDDARRMWESAQLAYALNHKVLIAINDAKKLNGYCVVERLDVVK